MQLLFALNSFARFPLFSASFLCLADRLFIVHDKFWLFNPFSVPPECIVFNTERYISLGPRLTWAWTCFLECGPRLDSRVLGLSPGGWRFPRDSLKLQLFESTCGGSWVVLLFPEQQVKRLNSSRLLGPFKSVWNQTKKKRFFICSTKIH